MELKPSIHWLPFIALLILLFPYKESSSVHIPTAQPTQLEAGWRIDVDFEAVYEGELKECEYPPQPKFGCMSNMGVLDSYLMQRKAILKWQKQCRAIRKRCEEKQNTPQ